MIKKCLFDNYCGRDVWLYELSGEGIKVGITDFGAAVNYIKIAADGAERDVCIGFDDIESRLESATYCGATIGRVANRIGGGRFALNGREYDLPKNDNGNTLHGGTCGFDRKFFDAKVDGERLTLSLVSADGDMGFPGSLSLSVRFTLCGRALNIEYEATSDEDTVWAPTCHAYFDLDGGRNIADTLLKINADCFMPVNAQLIPQGGLKSVVGTPFDFTSYKRIGESIDADDEQLRRGGGYDHNFVLNGGHAASARCESSGIGLDVYTDMPGVQFYSGNMMKGKARGWELLPRQAFCLEPQFFPDAVNNAQYASPILKAGETKRHFIKYEFSLNK